MIDPNKKTIIFDFGNVLLDLDFEGCFKSFSKLLDVDWTIKELPESISEAIGKYDRGQINDETFLWNFQQFNSKPTPRDLIDTWNSLLIGIKPIIFELLDVLSYNYNLCILSNINNFHLQWIHKYLDKTYQLIDFETRYFDHVFYSHIIGMRKPDDIIYNHVIDTLKVQPSDILFIDDLPENIEAAKKHGWNGSVHSPKDSIVDYIDNYIQEAWGNRPIS